MMYHVNEIRWTSDMNRQFTSQPAPMRNVNNYNNVNNGASQRANNNGGMNHNRSNHLPENNERPLQRQNLSSNASPASLTQDSQDNESTKRYKNIKSHGKSNAIEFAPDNTQKGWDTLRIEAAPKKGGNTKAYDWTNKVSVQVTKTELPIVVAVLLGFLPSCEFGNHGDTAKWFAIENQGTSFYIKVGQASDKRILPCPVPIVEAHLAGMLALSQYTKNFEGMTTDAALEAIKVMSGHMLKNNAFPKARQMTKGR